MTNQEAEMILAGLDDMSPSSESDNLVSIHGGWQKGDGVWRDQEATLRHDHDMCRDNQLEPVGL